MGCPSLPWRDGGVRVALQGDVCSCPQATIPGRAARGGRFELLSPSQVSPCKQPTCCQNVPTFIFPALSPPTPHTSPLPCDSAAQLCGWWLSKGVRCRINVPPPALVCRGGVWGG